MIITFSGTTILPNHFRNRTIRCYYRSRGKIVYRAAAAIFKNRPVGGKIGIFVARSLALPLVA
jgi:hypothetical protein